MRKKLFSGSKEIIKELGEKTLIVIYFFITGLIFDFIRYIISFFSNHKRLFPSENLQLYLIINACIFLISLILIIMIKNKYILAPLIGATFASIGFLNSAFVAIGIITVVWHFAFGAFAGLVFFIRSFFIDLKSAIEKVRKNEEKKILSLKDDTWTIFRFLIQITVAFGILTGVCMTILFDPGYEEINTKLMAIQMVTGFGFCAGSTFFWGIYPSIRFISEIRSKGY